MELLPMSAFVVSRRTVDVIVSALAEKSGQIWSPPQVFAGRLTGEDAAQIDLDEMGRAMFEVNARAGAGRYPGDAEMSDEGFDLARSYTWTRAYWPGIGLQALRCKYAKALRCLIYQCSEDATIDHPLLAELRAAQASLDAAIVCDLPDYEALPWDFPDDEPVSTMVHLSDLLPRF
jgi:hypothetical protein